MGIGRRMNGCGNAIKYGMFIINLLLFICGAVVFGLGLWALIDTGYMNELLGTNLYIGAIYVIVVTSALVCVLAFFGCVGAARQVKCMLLTYFILLFLVFVTMLIGGILAFVFREKMEQNLYQHMKTSMIFYNKYERSAVRYAWDTTQEHLRCCGAKDYSDWHYNHPESCCVETYGGQKLPCLRSNNLENINKIGCLDVVQRYVQRNAVIMGSAGIITALLLLIGMIFSCMLFKMIE